MRRRYCKSWVDAIGGPICNGTRDEYRKCNTGVFCLKMMTDIYGKVSTERVFFLARS